MRDDFLTLMNNLGFIKEKLTDYGDSGFFKQSAILSVDEMINFCEERLNGISYDETTYRKEVKKCLKESGLL